MSEEQKPRPFTYAYLDWLVESGFLPRLGRTARGILLVYLSHANADGVAWPGNARVVAALGTSERKLQIERDTLKKLGLMECVLPGGGATKSSRWQLLMPTQSPSVANGGLNDRGAIQTGAPGQNGHATPVKNGQKPRSSRTGEGTMERASKEGNIEGASPKPQGGNGGHTQSASQKKTGVDEHFEKVIDLVLALYPRQEALLGARRGVKSALKKMASDDEPLGLTLINKVGLYAFSRRHESPQYTPLPTKWFSHDKRHFDDPQEWVSEDWQTIPRSGLWLYSMRMACWLDRQAHPFAHERLLLEEVRKAIKAGAWDGVDPNYMLRLMKIDDDKNGELRQTISKFAGYLKSEGVGAT